MDKNSIKFIFLTVWEGPCLLLRIPRLGGGGAQAGFWSFNPDCFKTS